MTADDVRARLLPCPFCGNAKMEIHHNAQAGITFLLCGDDRGRGGCGAVVSFRPNLTGSKAIQAYNRRAYITPCGGCGNSDPEKRCLNCRHDFNAAHAELSGEVRELVRASQAMLDGLAVAEPAKRSLFQELRAALAKFTQEKPNG